MANFLLPLSGDVSQTINPWTWFTKVVGGQFGFININLGKSTDPELEQQILDAGGSSGWQLGNALEAVLAHVKTDSWEDEAKAEVTASRLLMSAVKRHFSKNV